MNTMLAQVRKEAEIIGETLSKKQLQSNTSKSNYVLLGKKAFNEYAKYPRRRIPFN